MWFHNARGIQDLTYYLRVMFGIEKNIKDIKMEFSNAYFGSFYYFITFAVIYLIFKKDKKSF